MRFFSGSQWSPPESCLLCVTSFVVVRRSFLVVSLCHNRPGWLWAKKLFPSFLGVWVYNYFVFDCFCCVFPRGLDVKKVLYLLKTLIFFFRLFVLVIFCRGFRLSSPQGQQSEIKPWNRHRHFLNRIFVDSSVARVEGGGRKVLSL